MDEVNIRTYIPECLRAWGVREIDQNCLQERSSIKGGRRAGIKKGLLMTKPGDQRAVAVKVVNMEYASRSSDPAKRLRLLVEYFKRESRIWNGLGDHENIVPLLGFVSTLQSNAFPSLVMPYYDGGNLLTFVTKLSIDLGGRVKLISDVACGLQHMHSRCPPVIHRDIKASNAIVEIHGRNEFRARLTDFGSAKLAEMENEIDLTGGTSAFVSFSWTPPEYVKISDSTRQPFIDYSCPTTHGDIWSLACTFLEILMEMDPWQGYCVENELLRGKHPPKPEGCGINDHCWDVMLICWGSRPDDRPSATGVLRWLTRLGYQLK